MAAARALWALAALAAFARGGADVALVPVPVYFGDAACNGAAGGVTLCRGGTLGAPVVGAGGVISYPNKSGGTPLWINGVVTQLDAASMQKLSGYGAQSIRTYTAVGGPAVLETALQYGLTVTMGLAIPIAAGSGGTYTTASGIAALTASLKPLVQACQNYSNLLFWMIGNEVEDPPYQGYGPIFSFMNQLAALIHEWDPYHPVGTATPDINAATLYSLNSLAPNLDVLGSNVYGAAMASNILVGANNAPSAANKLTVSQPLLGAAGTAYTVVPTYPNAIFGGCCSGSAATCSISGVTGATGAAISTPFANASCIWAQPGAGGALGTGPLKPFFLSELGPDNWWQVAQTPYGDWLEATSTQKAAVYAKNWQVAVATGSTAYTNIPPLLGGRGGGMLGGACVGAYAFSYGWVWQASATWINMLNNYNYTWNPTYGGNMAGGEEIEPIDTLAALWGGPRATNHAPYISVGIRINFMTSDMNVQVQTGTVASAAVNAADPDGDAITYTWLVLPMPSAPSNHNALAPVPFNMLSSSGGSIKFNPPTTPGFYRLTVWVSDGNGKAATHSIPFEATLLPAGVSAYCNADTYVQDGELSGGSYGPGSTNFGTAPFLSALWNGIPRNAPGAPGPGYGLSNNAFPYVAFGVPASWPAATTPSRVVAAFFVQGGAPLNNIGTQLASCVSTGDGSCTGYFLYSVPATASWAEASITWATSPCTGGATPSTTGVGSCAAGGPAAFMTASYNQPQPLMLPFQAPGAAQPPGLQMNGQYLYFDVTAQAAPLIAAGAASLSYMLLGAGPATRTTFFTSQEAHPQGQNGPFLSLWPPASAATVSTTMSLSGTTAMTPAAIATMQASVAATMPGVSASQVVISVVGSQVTTSVALSPAQVAAFTPAAQAAWAAGLAADAGVQLSNLVVHALVTPPAGRRHLLQAGSMEVPVTIIGFPPADATSGVPHGSTSDASNAIVQALGNSSSASASVMASSGLPGGVLLAEPPATWHHVSVASPPGGPGADPAVGSALLQANILNGGLAAEMGRRGIASDVGVAGTFMRPSAGLRSLNPFEQYRGGADGAGPAPAPAPAPSVVHNIKEARTALVLAIASICVAGVALCVAAGALLRVALTSRPAGDAAVKIPPFVLACDVEAPPAKARSRRAPKPPTSSGTGAGAGAGGEPLAPPSWVTSVKACDARTYNDGHL